MALQALVTAHAALGHNHFFKNNYLFRQWTDAGAILSYLDFAKGYIARCEERHGLAAVEAVLDAAHALMEQGVFRYRRPPKLSSEKQREGLRERLEYEERSYNDLWRTLPRSADGAKADEERAARSPSGRSRSTCRRRTCSISWKRTAWSWSPGSARSCRIVRIIAQYFYPQRQTQVMNEGCATFVHYTLMNTLFDRGRINEGAMLEILRNHSNVDLPAGLRRSALFRHQSLCAGPRHDAGHPAHRDRADGRGSRLVSRHRRQRRLARDPARRLGQPPRRVLHPPVSQPGPDPEMAVLRPWPTRPTNRITKSPRSTTSAATRRSAPRWPSSYDVGASRSDIQVVDVDLLGDRHLRLQHKVNDGIVLEKRQPRRDAAPHPQALGLRGQPGRATRKREPRSGKVQADELTWIDHEPKVDAI